LEEAAHGVVPTSAASARATLAAQKAGFERLASAEAWKRVIALVVQPGLEFGAAEIHHFDVASADGLSPVLDDYPQLAFEAHSTDYQQPVVFPLLAARRFAILKVGPALTFAYRQAVYALDQAACWHGFRAEEPLSATMERLMLSGPGHWARHYSGTDDEMRRLRHFSYADRIRYYWTQPEAETRIQAIHDSLAGKKLALPLLLQYFPPSVAERALELESDGIALPRALIHAQVQEALLPYFNVWTR
jgi:D-tagatose-1,6-bisphosphate aldolase subunit GatZ/KbaZ